MKLSEKWETLRVVRYTIYHTRTVQSAIVWLHRFIHKSQLRDIFVAKRKWRWEEKVIYLDCQASFFTRDLCRAGSLSISEKNCVNDRHLRAIDEEILKPIFLFTWRVNDENSWEITPIIFKIAFTRLTWSSVALITPRPIVRSIDSLST